MNDNINVSGVLKGIYHAILSTLVRLVARTGIHPNALTIVSLFPAILAGFAAANGAFLAAALLFLVSGILDLLDGELARQTGQSSRFGALLDSTLDRLSDAAIPVGLIAFYAPFGGVVIIPALVILSGFSISYVRARAEGLGMELPRLWMRREDRLAIVVIALLLAPISVPGINVTAAATLLVLALLAMMGFVAGVQALMAAARQR